MPIKNLSDVRRLPRVGKIHLGIKAQTEKGTTYPKAVDFFVVDVDNNTPQSSVDAFKKIYGDQPKELNIMFPSNDPVSFFQQWYKRYGQSKGLLCKGDGENATQVQADNTMIQKECPCVYLTGDQAKGIKPTCRRVANLQFLLAEVNGMGIWQIDTSSINSIININSMVDMIKGLTGGKISGIPLQLVIQPQEARVAGKMKTVFVLNLKINNSLLSMMSKANKDAQGALPPVEDKQEELLDEDPTEFPSEEVPQETAPAKQTPPPAAQAAKPATGVKTAPAAAAPAAKAQPAVQTPPPAQTPPPDDSGVINMDDLLDEKPPAPAAPAIPTCDKCGQTMVPHEGNVTKINPKTNKPFGHVKGWACKICKVFKPTLE